MQLAATIRPSALRAELAAFEVFALALRVLTVYFAEARHSARVLASLEKSQTFHVLFLPIPYHPQRASDRRIPAN